MNFELLTINFSKPNAPAGPIGKNSYQLFSLRSVPLWGFGGLLNRPDDIVFGDDVEFIVAKVNQHGAVVTVDEF